MDVENCLEWRIGIMSMEDKYLTAEGYGNKINACGTALRQKQTWTIEFHDNDIVYIRSYARNFLSVDRLGSVTCESSERGDSEQFLIEVAADGSGRWAFRNKKQKHYLAGTQDKIDCLAKTAADEELSLWYTPFVVHPQLNLYSLAVKKYAVADTEGVRFSGIKGWGARSLFTLEYYCGKYRIRTADNRYLCKDGTIIDTHDKDTLFGIEIHSTQEKTLKGLTLKDNEGRFLSAPNTPSGLFKSNQKVVKKEAIFRFDSCYPQVIIIGTEGKRACVDFGNEVMLKKQAQEPSTSEIYQLKYHGKKKKWSIETVEGLFWEVGAKSKINANAKTVSDEGLFEIIWLSNGMATIKGSNGKPLVSTGTGNLAANLPDEAKDEGFQIRLVNRPQIVLRCEFGYIGTKNATGSNKDEYICTKSFPSVISLELMDDGKYSLRGDNGKYWCVNLQTGGYPTIKANSAEPVPFVLEFRDTSVVTILAPNERYMTCDKIGNFHAVSTEVGPKCLLQF